MKARPARNIRRTRPAAATAEILILPDGTVYAHNITPQMASVLTTLDPANLPMRARAEASGDRRKPAKTQPPAS